MQSNGARIAVVAVAIGVVVALFFVLRGEEDDAGPETAAVPTATEVEEPDPNRAEKPKPEPEPEPQVATIAVEGGQPVGGVQKLEFEAGSRMLFRITSDQDAEFHLHGYDVEQTAPANGATTFDLAADIEGVFELEDHATAAPIAEISVTPG